MAIYHVHISSGSRADGQSAAVKVAYILREGAYGGRDDLVCWGSGNMPSWAAADPRQLFEAADLYERANGRLFVHVWVALPNELTESERHELGLAIAAALTAAGLPFVYSIHAGDPKSPGEPANPHIHIVISERVNDNIPREARQWFRRANPREPARGGAAKDRRLKEVTWVDDARRVAARLTNEYLALAGCKARVTADSHEVRIVEAEAWGDTQTADVLRQHPPGVHLGPAAAAIERDRIGGKRDEAPKVLRQGEPTERGDLARAKSAEGERIRGELELVAARLRRAREEERLATASVSAARSAGLSDGEILAVYEKEESASEGSGWAAVEAAAASRMGWTNEVEAAASRLGINVDYVVLVARERGDDPVLALEEAVRVFEEARAVLLPDEEIRRLWGEAESARRGRGWAAVAETTRTRAAWKARVEAAARAAGIDEVEAEYARAREVGEDPLAALERVTAERRRAGRRERLFGQPAGRELYIAWLTALNPDGEGRPTGAQVEQALTAAESDGARLARARGVFEGRWSRMYYTSAAGAFSDRITLAQVDAALTAAEGFAGRVAGLSRGTGLAVLTEAVAAGGELTVAELEAAVERAEEAEREAAARRCAAVERREAAIRETKSGPGWLLEAEQAAVRGADRRLTLDERESVATTVEGRIRDDFAGRLEALAATDAGVELLEQTPADGSAATLAAEEQVIELAEQRLEEYLAEQQRLFTQPGGEDLFTAHLAAVDPAWRPGGRTTAENRAAALTAAEADAARLARARGVFEGRWSRMHYTSAAGALGDRFTVEDVDAALTGAESFAGRVVGLSEGTGLAVLTEAVAAGGELTVAELEAAVERAEEAEREAAARRCAAVERREAAIRETKSGPGWLLEAEQAAVRGADRRLTLDERESVATTVEGRIRDDFAGRLEALAATDAGVELLEQTPADGSAATLAAEEQVIELAEQRLEEYLAEQQRLFTQPGGEDLFTAHLAAVDPAWRPGGRTTAENRAAALTTAEADAARLARARGVFEGRWSRMHYTSAAGALGDRFTVEDVDAALTGAESFAGRVVGLSEGTGLAVLTEAVAAGGELTVAELEAAVERAEEAEREAAARRCAAVERREAAIRETKSGPGWLLEAEQVAVRGADRRLTLDERESVATTVEGRIRDDFAGRLEALAATDAGVELLEQTPADGSAATLAAEEQVIELAEQRLEEYLAEQQRLFTQPGGEDLFTAHLAAVDPAWRPGGRTTAENRAAALTAAEADAARLARARGVFEGRWSRMHYTSAAGALGDRFTVEDVDAALTGAESFAGRVVGLSEGTGLAVLTEAVAAGGELTVAELEAAVERAEEAEREAAARRCAAVERREAAIRETKSGPGWLLEAEQAAVRGADRRLTLDERESVATTVEGRIREDFDSRLEALAATVVGAELLEEMQADASATTLAAEERVIELAEQRLEEHVAEQQQLFAQPGGEDLFTAHLAGIDPAWRPGGRTTAENRRAALRAASSDGTRLDRLRDVLGNSVDADCYRAALGARGDRFTVEDVDAAVEEALRRRADEELSIAETVELEIKEDLDRRLAAIEASAGGGELLKRVVDRRGGSPGSLAEREELLAAVEQRLRATDAAEERLPGTAPDPQRLGYRVPAVPDAVLDAVVAEDDAVFVADVVFVLRARYAQRAQQDMAAGGYDAPARAESARRHLGSALASALRWCVLKIREIILAACSKIHGGRGETGNRVEASLEAAKEARQARQREVESAAREIAIDVKAFSEAARAEGRDAVAALEEETARRRQVLSDAEAAGVDRQAVYASAEQRAAGSGFRAVEEATAARLERRGKVESTARNLDIDVDAVYAAARSKGEDTLEVLAAEVAYDKKVRAYAWAIHFPNERLDAIYDAAETNGRGSGYSAVKAACVRTKACEEMRKVLPFEAPDRARPGARVLAMTGEPSQDLLRQVEDDKFVHGYLSTVLAETTGSAEEREQAEGFYHLRQTRLELEKLKREHSGWFSSEPTEEDARRAVLARFVPTLAERVRKACAGIDDLYGLKARAVEEDWLRRVGDAMAAALPRVQPAGYSSQEMAVSDERFTRVAERTGNAVLKDIISTEFLEGFSNNDYGRSEAEKVHLGPRIRTKETSGLTREQAEAAVKEEHEAELLRVLDEVLRQVQPRPAEEVWRDLEDKRRGGLPRGRPGDLVSRSENVRNQQDRSQGWSR